MHQTTDIHVAAGVIYDTDGRVLIAKRPDCVPQGGLWEFPGGKLEAGETVPAALHRELQEELHIEVLNAAPMIRVRHRYPERSVLLDVWRVDRFAGTPAGAEGQPIAWVLPEQLAQFDFPAGNRPIVNAVRLPNRYAILDDETGCPDELLRRLHIIGRARAKMVQLRARQLSAHHFDAFAAKALPFCRERGIDLLINSDFDTARRLGADGVHLRSSHLMQIERRPEGLKWVGASVHNLTEIRQAERIGADFAVLGPVRPTASHPTAQPLGWPMFAELADAANLPVFALGGLSPTDEAVAWHHGAQGIAGIRGFLDENAL